MAYITKKMKNKIKNISHLFCFLISSLVFISLLSSCSLANDVSYYLDKISNEGNLEQTLNDLSGLDNLNNAKISSIRSDYKNISNEQFANFKEVEALGLKPNTIYRSASPIDKSSERWIYADNLIKKYEIKNIINLENTQNEALTFPGYNETYYSKQNILYAPIDTDLSTEQSKESILKIIKFINEFDGPYLILCYDGASKTGIICALLQALNTSAYDYLKAEYVNAYLNLYDNNENLISPLEMKFKNELAHALSLTNHNIIYLNLNKYTNLFLENCGLTHDEILNSSKKLSSFNQ